MLKKIISLKRVMTEKEFVISIVGGFVGVLLATFFSDMILEAEKAPMVLASTGASAVLMFSLPFSPLSQPWNLVGGHLVSAFAGVTCYLFIPYEVLAVTLSVSFSMLLMHHLRCMHPPGGATAITAVVGGASVHDLGYAFMMVPAFVNSIILLSVAMAIATFRDENPFEIPDKEEEKIDIVEE